MMSQTMEYALRAMMNIAKIPPGTWATCDAIATITRVPPGYLSKILRDLVVAGLVISQRGPNGGFALAKNPAQITMLDVVNAVDAFHRVQSCPLGKPEHVKLCPLHRRIDAAMDLLEKQFRQTTLAEMLHEERSQTVCPTFSEAPLREKSA
jgi:Rrf2 family nitric oxide-sensitive transcriptional repressor